MQNKEDSFIDHLLIREEEKYSEPYYENNNIYSNEEVDNFENYEESEDWQEKIKSFYEQLEDINKGEDGEEINDRNELYIEPKDEFSEIGGINEEDRAYITEVQNLLQKIKSEREKLSPVSLRVDEGSTNLNNNNDDSYDNQEDNYDRTNHASSLNNVIPATMGENQKEANTELFSPRDISELIEESNRLLREEFSFLTPKSYDKVITNNNNNEWNLEGNDYRSKLENEKIQKSSSPQKKLILRPVTPYFIGSSTFTFEDNEEEYNNKSFGKDIKSKESFTSPINIKDLEESISKPPPTPYNEPTPVYRSTNTTPRPMYSVGNGDNEEGMIFTKLSPQQLNEVKFQDIIRDLTKSTERLLSFSPENKDEKSFLSNYFISPMVSSTPPGYSTPFHYDSPTTTKGIFQFASPIQREDIGVQTPPSIEQYRHEIHGEKDYDVSKKQNLTPNEIINSIRRNREMKRNPSKGVNTAVKTLTVAPVNNNMIEKKSYLPNRSKSPIPYKSSPSKLNSRDVSKSPTRPKKTVEVEESLVPYSQVRHLQKGTGTSPGYNHSTIDWYLNLCSDKYSRRPTTPEKRNKVRYVGLKRQGRVNL
ncbi:hypothetical protein ABK040_012898 [Willaertia magna]